MDHNHESPTGGAIRPLFGLILFGSLAVAAFFLISEHRAHIFGGQWTGPALLIAFIGLHFLMHLRHGGHRGHGGGCGGQRPPRNERQQARKEGAGDER